MINLETIKSGDIIWFYGQSFANERYKKQQAEVRGVYQHGFEKVIITTKGATLRDYECYTIENECDSAIARKEVLIKRDQLLSEEEIDFLNDGNYGDKEDDSEEFEAWFCDCGYCFDYEYTRRHYYLEIKISDGNTGEYLFTYFLRAGTTEQEFNNFKDYLTKNVRMENGEAIFPDIPQDVIKNIRLEVKRKFQ
jgi:hypothetical protein